MQATERSWQRFISHGPVFDQDRLYAKEWAQWMLAELVKEAYSKHVPHRDALYCVQGAPDVLICLAASSVPEVLVLKMCIHPPLRCGYVR